VLDALREQDPALAAHVVVCEGEATSYTLVFNPPGVDRSFVACAGANATFTARRCAGAARRGARLFHFGYPPMMPLMYAEGGAQLAGLFESVRATGAATSLDMCGVDPRARLAPSIGRRCLPPRCRTSTSSRRRSTSSSSCSIAPALNRAALDRARLARLSGRLIEMGASVVAIKLGDSGLYLRSSPERASIDDLAARVPVDAASWRGAEVIAAVL